MNSPGKKTVELTYSLSPWAKRTGEASHPLLHALHKSSLQESFSSLLFLSCQCPQDQKKVKGKYIVERKKEKTKKSEHFLPFSFSKSGWLLLFENSPGFEGAKMTKKKKKKEMEKRAEIKLVFLKISISIPTKRNHTKQPQSLNNMVLQCFHVAEEPKSP